MLTEVLWDISGTTGGMALPFRLLSVRVLKPGAYQ